MYLNQRPPKVFYGWWIVGACVVILLYTSGVVHFGFTAVVEPIAEEFGWSYAQILLATIHLRSSPLFGYLLPKNKIKCAMVKKLHSVVYQRPFSVDYC